jgi:hypothetical protein
VTKRKREPVENTWARTVEGAVQAAFKKHQGLTAFGIPDETIEENVRASWPDEGTRTGWLEPHPFKVLVFTESGNFRDPYSYDDLFKYWNKVVKTLRDDPWHDDAGWESINQAVQYVWVEPKIIG